MFYNTMFNTEDLCKLKKRMYIMGTIFLIAGIAALSMPLLASLAVETTVGCLLLMTALSGAIGAFRGFKDGDTPWQEIVITIAAFIIAMIFLFRPLAGMFTMSMLLLAYFLVDAIAKISGYFKLRKVQNSVWVLVSGLLSLALAYMMWTNQATSLAMIGIILGINLTSGGLSLLFTGYGCSKLGK